MSGENSRGLDEMSMLLGGIKQQLAQISNAQAEDRVAAASYRTDIRKEVKELREDVQTVRSKVNTVTVDVAAMKPQVQQLETQRLMSAGAQRLAVGIGRFAHLIAGLIGGLLMWLLQHFFGPPPR